MSEQTGNACVGSIFKQLYIYNAVGGLVSQMSRLLSTGTVDFEWNLKTQAEQTAASETYLVVANVQNRNGVSETLKAKLGLKKINLLEATHNLLYWLEKNRWLYSFASKE